MASPNIEIIIKHFEFITESARPYIEDSGFKLNFNYSEYAELLLKIKNLSIDKPIESFELAKDIDDWIKYFSNLHSICIKLLADSEAYEKRTYAYISLTSNKDSQDNVSKGNRFADQDDLVLKCRLKKNALKAYTDTLEKKIKELERNFYLAKATYSNYYNDKQRYKLHP